MKIYRDIKQLNNHLHQLEKNTISQTGKGLKFVFTNGVFDLLHAGHIDLLEFAKKSGDILILGINDDLSVKRLKGDSRPIYPLEERMEILEAVMFIDYIIPFSEDTPLHLIQELFRVDVLVKGGDYSPHQVVGREEVESKGGKLLLFDFKTSISTTTILKKIKK